MSKYPTKKHRYKKGKHQLQKFDRSQLSLADKKQLQDFQELREMFQDPSILPKTSKAFKHSCPSCAYPTLPERGQYEFCILCAWEDSGKDDSHGLTIISAPNYISLIEARLEIRTLFDHFNTHSGFKVSIDPQEIIQAINSFYAGIFRSKDIRILY